MSGIFDFEKQIYLYSLNNKGKPGYDLITPLKINSNEILLINRGWIQKDQKGNKNINKVELNSYEGILKKITKPNPFKPDNNHIHHLLMTKMNYIKTFVFIQSLILIPFIF